MTMIGRSSVTLTVTRDPTLCSTLEGGNGDIAEISAKFASSTLTSLCVVHSVRDFTDETRCPSSLLLLLPSLSSFS